MSAANEFRRPFDVDVDTAADALLLLLLREQLGSW